MTRPYTNKLYKLFACYSYPLVLLLLFFIYHIALFFFVYDRFHLSLLRAMLMIPGIFAFPLLILYLYSIIAGMLNALSNKLANIFIGISIFLISISYLVQYFSIENSGSYLIPEAFNQIEAIQIFITWQLSVFTLLAILFLSLFLRKHFKHNSSKFRIRDLLRYAGFVTLLYGSVYLPFIAYYLKSKNNPDEYGIPKKAPEVELLSTIADFSFANETDSVSLRPDEVKRYYDVFGINININSSYPYYRNKISESDFPYKSSDTAKPNIIIFFIESLNACMLDCYGNPQEKITPYLNDFARNSCVIESYYNHTTPTINGLMGQLASFYPTFSNINWDNNKRPSYAKPYSIAHVLSTSGYTNYYMTHEAEGVKISMRHVMKDLGFDSIFMKYDLVQRYRCDDTYYLSDRNVMKAVNGFLKSKEQSEQPFFLAVSTIDTHTGHALSHDAKVFNKNASLLTNKIHALDDAFGQFWTYFRQSPFAKNTIVVFTSDHSYFPTKELKDYKNDFSFNSPYDTVPLIIYNYNSKLPERIRCYSSSIDLSPTILHMLGLNESQNYFQGLSIFSERKQFPNLFCVSGEFIESFKLNKSKNTDSLVKKVMAYNL